MLTQTQSLLLIFGGVRIEMTWRITQSLPLLWRGERGGGSRRTRGETAWLGNAEPPRRLERGGVVASGEVDEELPVRVEGKCAIADFATAFPLDEFDLILGVGRCVPSATSLSAQSPPPLSQAHPRRSLPHNPHTPCYSSANTHANTMPRPRQSFKTFNRLSTPTPHHPPYMVATGIVAAAVPTVHLVPASLAATRGTRVHTYIRCSGSGDGRATGLSLQYSTSWVRWRRCDGGFGGALEESACIGGGK